MKEIQSESTLPGAGKGKMINVESTNKMSNYGNKIMHNQYSRREEDRVYERLEKPYNIVTNFPKEYQTVHRKFPKYSLEHQLIEQNKFPDIKWFIKSFFIDLSWNPGWISSRGCPLVPSRSMPGSTSSHGSSSSTSSWLPSVPTRPSRSSPSMTNTPESNNKYSLKSTFNQMAPTTSPTTASHSFQTYSSATLTKPNLSPRPYSNTPMCLMPYSSCRFTTVWLKIANSSPTMEMLRPSWRNYKKSPFTQTIPWNWKPSSRRCRS